VLAQEPAHEGGQYLVVELAQSLGRLPEEDREEPE
jgi:hypothetical protein